MKLFSGTISTLEQALNYSTTKQKVISHNIANADTPNYKSLGVSFKQTLNEQMVQPQKVTNSNKKHFELQPNLGSSIIIKRDHTVQYNQNGNSVDLDKEMTELATNQIYYNALIERINGKFSSLQNVIRGGK